MGTVTRLDRVREARARFGADLLAHPDVHGVGVGYKRRGGKTTRSLAVVVHVHRKLASLTPSRRIPSELRWYEEGENRWITVPTDVWEVVPLVDQPKRAAVEPECSQCLDWDVNLTARVRPVPGGFNIASGGSDVTEGGTLGGWVWDRENGQIVLLSNDHVLGSKPGTAVYQPGSRCGLGPGDRFAEIVRASSDWDATIAVPDDESDICPEIERQGPAVFEIGAPSLQMPIVKVGDGSNLTCGLIIGIDYQWLGEADKRIDPSVLVEPRGGTSFSKLGDSGALYLDARPNGNNPWKRVVGLHRKGNGELGAGSPFPAVASALKIGPLGELLPSVVEAVATAENDRPAGFYRHLARDLEARIGEGAVGEAMLEALGRHRIDLVATMLNGDGRRATEAALAPMLRGIVTTDEVLRYRITEEDVANIDRLLRVIERIRPESVHLLELLRGLLRGAPGCSIGEILRD